MFARFIICGFYYVKVQFSSVQFSHSVVHMFLLFLLSGGFFLIINGCGILSKTFSASIEIIICFLSFSLLMWCITLIDFDIEESLHPWDKAHLVIMYDLFDMLLDSVC